MLVWSPEKRVGKTHLQWHLTLFGGLGTEGILEEHAVVFVCVFFFLIVAIYKKGQMAPGYTSY